MRNSDNPRISSLGYALLSLLARRNRSGYEMSHSTSPPLDSLLWSAGHSQIYPELAKLADAGYVNFAAVAQARRPDKKVYRLSEAGSLALKSWVRQPPKPAPDRRELTVKAHAAWLIDPAEAAKVFRDQAERTRAEILEIGAYHDRLQTQSEETFPPRADEPMFGTYANAIYALDSRRQLVEWCLWVAEQFDTAIEVGRKSA